LLNRPYIGLTSTSETKTSDFRGHIMIKNGFLGFGVISKKAMKIA